MIPIKLTLKNFMSYGDPPVTVPFEGLHVACLSGDNGNGKSAVLDGITWALWGKTRASAVKSVSEDELIRLGASEAEVQFEFELNGHIYRVIKKRKRGKSTSVSDWQLAQRDASGEWAPIGANTQREIGRQISQLLSMEYETFLNSAYLQQGHADEFTRQTPDNRKRILSEILGLGRYDRLEEKARDRLRQRREAVEELDREIRLLEGQVAQLAEHRIRLEETRAALIGARDRIAEQEKIAAELRARVSRLDTVAEQLTLGEAQLSRLRADMVQREVERSAQAKLLGDLQSVLEQKEAIEADHVTLQKALQKQKELEPLVESFNRANAELRTVIGAIDGAEKELLGDIKVAENQIANTTQRCRERAAIEAQALALARDLNAEPDYEELLAAAQAEQMRLQQEFSNLSAANKELSASLDDLKEVIELLAQPRAVCPVCDSDLSGEKQARVLNRQERRREEMADQQRVLQREGRAKKQELVAMEQLVTERVALRDAQTTRRSRLASLQEHHGRLGDPEAELAVARAGESTLRQRLDRQDFAAPQRAQRKRLENETARFGMAKKEYEAVKAVIQRFDDGHRRYQDLMHAETAWGRECEEMSRLERILAERGRDLADAQEALKRLRCQLEHDAGVRQAAAEADAALKRLQSEVNSLQVSEGSLIRYIAEAERAEADRKTREQRRKHADDERRIYQALANAFGKKGVQTLIIENAIPELAEETNDLLARMTDNAMQVSFETTRTARQGGHEIETLDIRVMDDAGTRPYELFSGGEAFRINFAIRIALSRLLARRAGARLQTLIMDEGFGSQDGKGREKLIEVIDTIKDDFDKILVITHVEDLRDAFSQRIEITKDAAGSHVHLL